MLGAWLELPANRSVRWLSATVAQDNEASERLFRGFARDQGVACVASPHFTEDLLVPGHAPEPMYRIGPFDSSAAASGQFGVSAA
jgi:L-2,4-diaminobutyric acid acetyltransferase